MGNNNPKSCANLSSRPGRSPPQLTLPNCNPSAYLLAVLTPDEFCFPITPSDPFRDLTFWNLYAYSSTFPNINMSAFAISKQIHVAESNLRLSNSTLRCSTTEPQRLHGERGLLRRSYMTRVLFTARISNVDGVMFCK